MLVLRFVPVLVLVLVLDAVDLKSISRTRDEYEDDFNGKLV